MSTIEAEIGMEYSIIEKAVRDLTSQARNFLAAGKLHETIVCLSTAQGKVLDYQLKLREGWLNGGVKDEAYERASLSLLREPIEEVLRALELKQARGARA